MSPALTLQKNAGQLTPVEIEEEHDSMRWVMASPACAVIEQDADSADVKGSVRSTELITQIV